MKQTIEIKRIVPSKTNPRKNFEDASKKGKKYRKQKR